MPGYQDVAALGIARGSAALHATEKAAALHAAQEAGDRFRRPLAVVPLKKLLLTFVRLRMLILHATQDAATLCATLYLYFIRYICYDAGLVFKFSGTFPHPTSLFCVRVCFVYRWVFTCVCTWVCMWIHVYIYV